MQPRHSHAKCPDLRLPLSANVKESRTESQPDGQTREGDGHVADATGDGELRTLVAIDLDDNRVAALDRALLRNDRQVVAGGLAMDGLPGVAARGERRAETAVWPT